MKKIYINPQMSVLQLAAERLIADSTPNVGINLTGSVDAADVEVKGQDQIYDVWDDDWSK